MIRSMLKLTFQNVLDNIHVKKTQEANGNQTKGLETFLPQIEDWHRSTEAFQGLSRKSLYHLTPPARPANTIGVHLLIAKEVVQQLGLSARVTVSPTRGVSTTVLIEAVT